MDTQDTNHTSNRLSQEHYQALQQIEATSTCIERFRFGKLRKQDSTPRFYVELPSRKASGAFNRISRQDRTALENLLQPSAARSEETVWFWIGQLLHYGLYDPSVKSRSVKKIIKRSRTIIKNKSFCGQLQVPARIKQHEQDLIMAYTDMAPSSPSSTPSSTESTTSSPYRSDFENIDNASAELDFLAGSKQLTTTNLTDFPRTGRFTARELQVLHAWRDRFCIRHDITRDKFQIMMTRSHSPLKSSWTFDFITKKDFMKEFVTQLPRRKPLSLQTFRARYDWNPPGEVRLALLRLRPRTVGNGPRQPSASDAEDEDDLAEVVALKACIDQHDKNTRGIRSSTSFTDQSITISGVSQGNPQSAVSGSDTETSAVSYDTSLESQATYEPSSDSEASSSCESSSLDDRNDISVKRKEVFDEKGRTVHHVDVSPESDEIGGHEKSGRSSDSNVQLSGVNRVSPVATSAKASETHISCEREHVKLAPARVPNKQNLQSLMTPTNESHGAEIMSKSGGAIEMAKSRRNKHGSNVTPSQPGEAVAVAIGNYSSIVSPRQVDRIFKINRNGIASTSEARRWKFNNSGHLRPIPAAANLLSSTRASKRFKRFKRGRQNRKRSRPALPNSIGPKTFAPQARAIKGPHTYADQKGIVKDQREIHSSVPTLEIPVAESIEKSPFRISTTVVETSPRNVLVTKSLPKHRQSSRPPLEELTNTFRSLPIPFRGFSPSDEGKQAETSSRSAYRPMIKSSSNGVVAPEDLRRPDLRHKNRLRRLENAPEGQNACRREQISEDNAGLGGQIGNVHAPSGNHKKIKGYRETIHPLPDANSLSGDVADGTMPAASASTSHEVAITTKQTPKFGPVRRQCIPRAASHPGTPSESEPSPTADQNLLSKPSHGILPRTSTCKTHVQKKAIQSRMICGSDSSGTKLGSQNDTEQGAPMARPTKEQVRNMGIHHGINMARSSLQDQTPKFSMPLKFRKRFSDPEDTSSTQQLRPTLRAASAVDRSKPYGHRENPQIIPSTPQPARFTTPAIKPEYTGGSIAPLSPNPLSVTPSSPSSIRLHSAVDPAGQTGKITLVPMIAPSLLRKSTPPTTANRGIPRFTSLGPQNSRSLSPSFSEVMRNDDRLFRKAQPKLIKNPTRNSFVQSLVARTPLDRANLTRLDQFNDQVKGGSRVVHAENDTLSRRTHLCPVPIMMLEKVTEGNAGSLKSGSKRNVVEDDLGMVRSDNGSKRQRK